MEDLKFRKSRKVCFFLRGDVDLTCVDTCNDLRKRMLCVCARRGEKKKQQAGANQSSPFFPSVHHQARRQREREGVSERE